MNKLIKAVETNKYYMPVNLILYPKVFHISSKNARKVSNNLFFNFHQGIVTQSDIIACKYIRPNKVNVFVTTSTQKKAKKTADVNRYRHII